MPFIRALFHQLLSTLRVLQCVTLCCSVLQSVAVRGSVLQSVAVRGSVLQYLSYSLDNVLVRNITVLLRNRRIIIVVLMYAHSLRACTLRATGN